MFRQDIKLAQAKVGEFAQEQSEAYKQIKKRAYIQTSFSTMASPRASIRSRRGNSTISTRSGLPAFALRCANIL
ncbi:hypothetical protein SHLA_176c000010 [Shinella sp. DD12]|nr:hypothetical protein SHLA_176c000010 [Shinella sp. DD12]